MCTEKQNSNDIILEDPDMSVHGPRNVIGTPSHGGLTSLILSENVINSTDNDSSQINTPAHSQHPHNTLPPLHPPFQYNPLPAGQQSQVQQQLRSGTLTDRPVMKNGSSTMLTNGIGLYTDHMTSSATSFTNSVGSSTAYDNSSYEPNNGNHSRSNSSQTSSSRISTGFNSLPSHSRQGSADSEVTSR